MPAKVKEAELEAPSAEAELDDEEELELEHERDDDEEELEEEEAEEADGFTPEEFEAEQRRHEGEMRRMLGAAFDDLITCEQCGGVGLHPGSMEVPPELLADPDAVVCPTCNGYGFRSTPSLVESASHVTCPRCQGAGWRDRRQLEAEAQAAAYHPPAPTVELPAPNPTQPVWDQARGIWLTPDGQPIYAPPMPAPVT